MSEIEELPIPMAPPLKFEILEECSRTWSLTSDYRSLSIKRTPLLSRDSRVFTLGSCFAEEVKLRLNSGGYATSPNYPEDFDSERISAARIQYNHTNHYHSYAILQEIEKALSLWKQPEDDYWQVPDHIWKTDSDIWQDPYRRGIYGRSLDDVRAVTCQLDDAIRGALSGADLFMFTLDLIEVWQKKDNGRMAAAGPGWEEGGGRGQLRFHLSSFHDNYANVARIVELITGFREDAKIVFTVSPVPLFMTRTDMGCVVANTESKAVLRAAAGQIARDHPNVTYFPAYEICMNTPNAFEADGRHVRRDTVNVIMDAFQAAHLE